MAKKIWTFELDDGQHDVSLDHSYFSGKRKILIDGKDLVLPISEARQYPDFGSIHTFNISGHECAILIKTNGITFTYELVIDGIANSTGEPLIPDILSQSKIESAIRRKISIVVFISTSIFSFWWTWRMITNEGYYSPFLAMLAPALIVLAIYFIIFKDAETTPGQPIPIRLWITFILAFALGILHLWILDPGYFYDFLYFLF